MIEAVNSTVANATTVRGVVGQMDSASVSAVATVLPASGSNAAPSAPQAPFVSPYISVDFNFNKPVLQIRDTQTGAVKQQFPTEGRMVQIASSQAQMRATMQGTSTVTHYVETAPSPALQASQTAVQTVDVTTVQDVTATPASNTASSTPQIAVAALSAAAQSSASSSAGATESGVTVYA